MQTLVNQADWTAEDKKHFEARIESILTELTAPEPVRDESHLLNDVDLATATESELFAILDEDFPV